MVEWLIVGTESTYLNVDDHASTKADDANEGEKIVEAIDITETDNEVALHDSIEESEKEGRG